jgi:hypothetical protein
MHISMMSVVIFLFASAGTMPAVYRLRSARRCRAEQAGWERFRRRHADLDRELDRIWNRR